MSAGFIEVRDQAWNTRGTEAKTKELEMLESVVEVLLIWSIFLKKKKEKIMEAAGVGIDADSCRLNCQ